jgi:UDP-N-acetylglucosamine--N-acetylmuramyl-(pentapeptide) pyrophosphoryl-undecaprenol N-acetylglucosamine transferase
MKRILLTGGGTGGHIYPALAIARAVREKHPDVEIGYIGTDNGLESKIVPKEEGIQFFTVEIQGFRRSLSWENVNTVRKFIRAVSKSKEYIKKFQPDVVVGTGGYVSGPAVFAAHQLNIPTMIHEQNAVLGLTTKFLSRFADVVAVSLEDTSKQLTSAKKVVYTGNPRATEVIRADRQKGRESLGIAENVPVVLIFGGSRGAKAINQAVLSMLPKLSSLPGVRFVYVTGEVHYQDITSKINGSKYPNLDIRPFVYNMPDVLATTDLVVARAGASTLAELTALGLPSILIPSPYVTNNHQEANARVLEEQGAARLLLERDCSGESLWNQMEALILDPEERKKMSEQARSLGRPEAATLIVEELEQLAASANVPS